jgi:hypothetical protein
LGLGKALGFSLLAYIGLNFLFVIISETISGNLNTLFSDITSNPLIILLIFFGPIASVPSSEIFTLYTQIAFGTFDATLIETIGFIVTPFIAAVVAGRTGGSKGSSFGGWMIACLIGSAALGVLAFINPATLLYYGIIVANPVMLLIMFLITGAINGIFYGAFALLFTKTEMY